MNKEKELKMLSVQNNLLWFISIVLVILSVANHGKNSVEIDLANASNKFRDSIHVKTVKIFEDIAIENDKIKRALYIRGIDIDSIDYENN